MPLRVPSPFILPVLAAALAGPALAQPRAHRPVAAMNPAPVATDRIVAVVNGDAITTGDVDNRARLFAVSSGLPMSPDVLARLRPQIIRQLINERLELQEMERRKIVVSDADIVRAIGGIEQRNGMPAGALTKMLAGQGIAARTLIDEVRVQIGWVRVLRQQLGPEAEVSKADIDEQLRRLKRESGQPEYNLSEIFIPVEDPSKEADAERFAETVISQLRQGAPFPVVAAQFSQSQTALDGGALGWVHASQLDPAVANLVGQMPPGAISNPIVVPGGIDIVQLKAKREVGNDIETVVNLRQVFMPFDQRLNPAAPTAQQKAVLLKAQQITRTTASCPAMEQVAKEVNSSRPPDPGDVKLAGIASAPLRQLLGTLPLNQASKPIVTPDGIAVIMVCSRGEKNVAEASRAEIKNQLLEQRVELASRQLLRSLRRRAVLEERSSAS